MIDVRSIDPADEAQLRAWWEVGAAVAAAERPYDAWPAWSASRVHLVTPRSDVDRVLLVAEDDGLVVGSGMLVLFRLDNTHLAELDVQVRPEHRRRGTGRLLLAELERLAAADGRTTYVGTAYAPVDRDNAATAFTAACGYPVGSLEESKLLDLGTAPAHWPPLEEDVAVHRGDYRLETFEERVPERWVEDFCAMLAVFMRMIPQGDLDLEDAVWTPTRLHEYEQRTLAAGRAWLVAVAVAPDGRLCGFTELGVERADPRLASIGGTLVLPEHRGHRLGLGLKLASHRRLLELFPTCPVVVTTNAGVNAPMNAVNEALGYRVVERCLDVQKRR